MMKTVDVIIPVYKPGREFKTVLKRLSLQSYKINRIILINTDKEYFDDNIFLTYPNTQVYHITHNEFDHGATRQMGAELSDADYILFMTMDAVPKDKNLVAKLVLPLEKGDAAVSFARQIPKHGASYTECYSRNYNYPAQSRITGYDDISKLGIRAFFCSDVCAMYDRRIHEKLGGFESNMIFNEDMVYAYKALKAGYKVFYNASAEVYHSHDYTIWQQFQRNFDLGVSQKMYDHIFSKISSENEGIKYFLSGLKYLAGENAYFEMVHFCAECIGKYVGYRLGKKYASLPQGVVQTLSMNKNYWK